jgi:hypothetical protein
MYSKKIIVCYLFTGFDKITSFNQFIRHYKKFNSGIKHELLICYKLLKKKKIDILEKKIKDINHHFFIDPIDSNDWDFGSYKRVAQKYNKDVILFMNSHSYPITSFWLKKFIKHFKNKTIIASSGSFESITQQVRFKKPFNFISYFKKKIKGKRSFNDFPNPHLNTSSFMINSGDFLKYIKNKSFSNKYETWKIESGFNSLTNFFKRRNFKLFVVNSDGKKFKEHEWMLSETYHYKKQSKSIISDKHSRKYLQLTINERKKSQFNVWGV